MEGVVLINRLLELDRENMADGSIFLEIIGEVSDNEVKDIFIKRPEVAWELVNRTSVFTIDRLAAILIEEARRDLKKVAGVFIEAYKNPLLKETRFIKDLLDKMEGISGELSLDILEEMSREEVPQEILDRARTLELRLKLQPVDGTVLLQMLIEELEPHETVHQINRLLDTDDANKIADILTSYPERTAEWLNEVEDITGDRIGIIRIAFKLYEWRVLPDYAIFNYLDDDVFSSEEVFKLFIDEYFVMAKRNSRLGQKKIEILFSQMALRRSAIAGRVLSKLAESEDRTYILGFIGDSMFQLDTEDREIMAENLNEIIQADSALRDLISQRDIDKISSHVDTAKFLLSSGDIERAILELTNIIFNEDSYTIGRIFHYVAYYDYRTRQPRLEYLCLNLPDEAIVKLIDKDLAEIPYILLMGYYTEDRRIIEQLAKKATEDPSEVARIISSLYYKKGHSLSGISGLLGALAQEDIYAASEVLAGMSDRAIKELGLGELRTEIRAQIFLDAFKDELYRAKELGSEEMFNWLTENIHDISTAIEFIIGLSFVVSEDNYGYLFDFLGNDFGQTQRFINTFDLGTISDAELYKFLFSNVQAPIINSFQAQVFYNLAVRDPVKLERILHILWAESSAESRYFIGDRVKKLLLNLPEGHRKELIDILRDFKDTEFNDMQVFIDGLEIIEDFQVDSTRQQAIERFAVLVEEEISADNLIEFIKALDEEEIVWAIIDEIPDGASTKLNIIFTRLIESRIESYDTFLYIYYDHFDHLAKFLSITPHNSPEEISEGITKLMPRLIERSNDTTIVMHGDTANIYEIIAQVVDIQGPYAAFEVFNNLPKEIFELANIFRSFSIGFPNKARQVVLSVSVEEMTQFIVEGKVDLYHLIDLIGRLEPEDREELKEQIFKIIENLDKDFLTDKMFFDFYKSAIYYGPSQIEIEVAPVLFKQFLVKNPASMREGLTRVLDEYGEEGVRKFFLNLFIGLEPQKRQFLYSDILRETDQSFYASANLIHHIMEELIRDYIPVGELYFKIAQDRGSEEMAKGLFEAITAGYFRDNDIDLEYVLHAIKLLYELDGTDKDEYVLGDVIIPIILEEFSNERYEPFFPDELASLCKLSQRQSEEAVTMELADLDINKAYEFVEEYAAKKGRIGLTDKGDIQYLKDLDVEKMSDDRILEIMAGSDTRLKSLLLHYRPTQVWNAIGHDILRLADIMKELWSERGREIYFDFVLIEFMDILNLFKDPHDFFAFLLNLEVKVDSYYFDSLSLDTQGKLFDYYAENYEDLIRVYGEESVANSGLLPAVLWSGAESFIKLIESDMDKALSLLWLTTKREEEMYRAGAFASAIDRLEGESPIHAMNIIKAAVEKYGVSDVIVHLSKVEAYYRIHYNFWEQDVMFTLELFTRLYQLDPNEGKESFIKIVEPGLTDPDSRDSNNFVRNFKEFLKEHIDLKNVEDSYLYHLPESIQNFIKAIPELSSIIEEMDLSAKEKIAIIEEYEEDIAKDVESVEPESGIGNTLFSVRESAGNI